MLTNIIEPTSYVAPLSDDGYVQVTNNGAFSATLFVQYFYDGSYYPINSDLFAVGTSKQIIIPKDATNIFVLVRIANGLGQFTPVYNYNFDKSRVLKLNISGSIFDQSCEDVTNDPAYPPTIPPQYYISVENSGGFIARFSVKYTFSNSVYTIESQNFTVGMTRDIILPPSCTNIFILIEYYNGIKWVPLYNNNFNDPQVLNMQLYGTIFSPQYKILPNPSGVGAAPAPQMLVVQYPSNSEVYSGEVVLVITNVSNIGNAVASKVSLTPNLPSNASFIPGSLTVNNTALSNTTFPTDSIPLGNIDVDNTVIVTYQLVFKSIASTDTLVDPTINYISGSANDSNSQIVSYTGTSTPLTVNANTPCNCTCTCSCNSTCNNTCNSICNNACNTTCNNICNNACNNSTCNSICSNTCNSTCSNTCSNGSTNSSVCYYDYQSMY